MKTIKELIISRVTNPKKYNYYIWRGIVELLYQRKENKAMTQEMALAVGYWAAFDKRYFCVENITDLFYIDKVLYIATRRPGLLIGKRGEDIESLEESINKTNHLIDKIYIIETINPEPTVVIRNTMNAMNDYL